MLCAGNTAFGSEVHTNDWICAGRRYIFFIVTIKRNFKFYLELKHYQ